MQGIRMTIEVQRKQILEYNIKKLSKRYGTKYSNKAAKTRADKEEA